MLEQANIEAILLIIAAVIAYGLFCVVVLFYLVKDRKQ